jgi:arsenite methyltransferase
VDGNRPDLIASKAGRKGSYGIDAPRLLPVLGLFFIANIVQGVISGKLWPFLGAAVILGCAGRGLYASRWGKFLVWAELLDQRKLRGDERILDIGCGRHSLIINKVNLTGYGMPISGKRTHKASRKSCSSKWNDV